MSDLAGVLWLAPGRAMPHGLRSSRQAWAARMAPGRPAQQLPGLLAGLYSLCGESHRMASRLALQAADPGLLAGPPDVSPVLQQETARMENLINVRLDGATEYELSEVFGKVINTAAGVTEAKRYSSSLVPDNPPGLLRDLAGAN